MYSTILCCMLPCMPFLYYIYGPSFHLSAPSIRARPSIRPIIPLFIMCDCTVLYTVRFSRVLENH